MSVRKTSAPEKQSTIRRRSGRLSTSAQKSSYFEDPHDSDETEPAAKKRRKATSKRETKYEEESEDRYEESADEAHHDDEQNEYNDGNQEEEEGEEEDDAPRKVVILPLEKLRDTGGVDYADHKVHRNTLLFLKDLKANNRRAWLKCELLLFLRDGPSQLVVHIPIQHPALTSCSS